MPISARNPRFKDDLPPVPRSGQWTDSDGEVYVLRRVARSLGFTPPFLDLYQREPHPAIARTIRVTTGKFALRRGRGVTEPDGFSLTDLKAIKGAKVEPGKEHLLSASELAKVLELKESQVRSRFRGVPRKVARETKQGLAWVTELGFDLKEARAATRKTACSDEISFAAAAEKIEQAIKRRIPLQTLHSWARSGKLPRGEKKLESNDLRRKHRVPMRFLPVQDLDERIELLKKALPGIHADERGNQYVIPDVADQEFTLPRGDSSAYQFLANLANRRKITRRQEWTWNRRGRFLEMYLYPVAELESLFPRRIAGRATGSKPRGRPRSDGTAEIQKACAEQYERVRRGEIKLTGALSALKKCFGGRAPKYPADVRRNAKRWNERKKGGQN